MKNIILSPEAVKQAAALGISTGTELELIRMVKFSAPYTHPRGNRRYEDFIFKVKGGELLSVTLLDAKKFKIRVRRSKSPKYVCIDCKDDGGFCLSCRTFPSE